MSIAEELPLVLRFAYLALHRKTDQLFSSVGMTADQFVLLYVLSKEDNLTQKELAQRISSDPSTIRAMLVLLERRGLIQRHSDRLDSRANRVHLTKQGRLQFRQLWQLSESIRDDIVGLLPSRDAAKLIELLKHVAEKLCSKSADDDRGSQSASPELAQDKLNVKSIKRKPRR